MNISKPVNAHRIYWRFCQAGAAPMAIVTHMRELTRSDKQLLLKENIAYGFHRNMLAMRGMGFFTSAMGLVYGLVIAAVLQLKPVSITLANLGDPGLAGGLTMLVLLAMLLAWSLYFDEDKVRRMGFVYAERLFECLSSIPGTSKSRSLRRKKPDATTSIDIPSP